MAIRVTIYDVAAEAGVSISTVSRALSASGRVNAETRQKVLAAADALGFTPMAAAVAKGRGGVGRIGVLAAFTSYPSYARRLAGVLQAVSGRPFEVAVFDLASAGESTSPLLDTLPVAGRLDGLIVMGRPLDERIAERLSKRMLPTVLVDSQHPSFDSVRTDNAAGGRLVADHLLGQGYRHFGFVGEAQKSDLYVSPSQGRLIGFRAAVQEAGYSLPEGSVRHTSKEFESARAAARDLLSINKQPTGIFAHSDLLAAGVLKAASDVGLHVPAELAVVGYDDSDLAEALELTTVRQPLEESGRAATELLLQRMSSPAGAVRAVALQLELVERGTS